MSRFVSTDLKSRGLAGAVLHALDDGEVVLAVPHTAYRLHLVVRDPARITTRLGKRIKGTIEARALRMHPADAGGCFIEPVWGHPRIVQGIVRGKDRRKILVDVSVPMWVTLHEGQDPDEIEEGQMVNFYVESGATFQPVDS